MNAAIRARPSHPVLGSKVRKLRRSARNRVIPPVHRAAPELIYAFLRIPQPRGDSVLEVNASMALYATYSSFSAFPHYKLVTIAKVNPSWQSRTFSATSGEGGTTCF
jgi:hypothetical protein